MDDGTSSKGAEVVRTGRLEALAPGQAIPFGGDRVAYVTPELAAAFRPKEEAPRAQRVGTDGRDASGITLLTEGHQS